MCSEVDWKTDLFASMAAIIKGQVADWFDLKFEDPLGSVSSIPRKVCGVEVPRSILNFVRYDCHRLTINWSMSDRECKDIVEKFESLYLDCGSDFAFDGDKESMTTLYEEWEEYRYCFDETNSICQFSDFFPLVMFMTTGDFWLVSTRPEDEGRVVWFHPSYCEDPDGYFVVGDTIQEALRNYARIGLISPVREPLFDKESRRIDFDSPGVRLWRECLQIHH